MASKRKSKPDWSTLPPELLTSIADLLPSRLDILRYRAVCRSFRSSVPTLPEPQCPYPHLSMPATILCQPQPEHRRFLKQSRLYAMEPLTKISKAQTWILRVEESGDGVSIVRSPFARLGYCMIHMIRESLPETLNLLDYRVREMGKLYELNSYRDRGGSIGTKFTGRKFVVSDDGSSVMGVITSEGIDRFVAWRNGDEDWTHINVDDGSNPGFWAEDIVYHNEKFYAIYRGGLLITVDPKSLNITEIGLTSIKLRHHRKYLVKSSNDLILVIKYWRPGYDKRISRLVDLSESNRTGNCDESCFLGFRISKFDEEKKSFVRAKNTFKDKVVFVGDDFLFTVLAKEFPGLQKNSVYLEDMTFREPGPDVYMGMSDCVGVFDLGKRTGRPLYAYPDKNLWFWPPPTWLKSSSKSSCG